MKLKIKKHFWYYFSFILIQIVGLILVLLTASDKPLRIMVILATSAFYIFWAIMHQKIHHSLTSKIMLEYTLIGIFGITISLFLFNI